MVGPNGYGIVRDRLAPTKSPTTRDLEWAAGFLEGEGTFTRTRSNSHMVEASQKDPETLHRLQSLFGGQVKNYKKHQPIYRWWLTGARARGLMMTLYVLMSKRRKTQIEEALSRRYWAISVS